MNFFRKFTLNNLNKVTLKSNSVQSKRFQMATGALSVEVLDKILGDIEVTIRIERGETTSLCASFGL